MGVVCLHVIIKALGNYVSNLAHTYFLNVFTKTVHTWTKVIVNNHCHCFKCIFLYCMTSKIGLMWLSAKLYRIPTISLAILYTNFSYVMKYPFWLYGAHYMVWSQSWLNQKVYAKTFWALSDIWSLSSDIWLSLTAALRHTFSKLVRHVWRDRQISHSLQSLLFVIFVILTIRNWIWCVLQRVWCVHHGHIRRDIFVSKIPWS